MRTNIVIDDLLMEEALMLSKAQTKKDVVEKALRLLIAVSRQKSISKFKGTLNWQGDLESLRTD